jgi:hypothetical protein
MICQIDGQHLPPEGLKARVDRHEDTITYLYKVINELRERVSVINELRERISTPENEVKRSHH